MEGQLPDDDSQSPISQLPPECLEQIFSWLPIADRVRIQRVCTLWRDASLNSWFSCKTLSFNVEDWGYRYWLGSGVDQVVMKKVLKLCGRHLTRIDFSEYRDPDKSNLTRDNESLFASMKDLCPNLTAIDIRSLEVTAQGLECLGQSYSNLTEFAIGSQYYNNNSVNLDESLSLLFRNNKNLQRVILHVASDGKCLSDLNPSAIEEISVVHGYGGEETICRALKRFINLRNFGITNWAMKYRRYGYGGEDGGYINDMLKAIEPSSETLQELTISSMLFDIEILSKNLKCFGNLERLVLDGDKLTIDDLKIVTKYCRKITSLHLNAFQVTDLDMESVMELPKLQQLHLSCLGEITDDIFKLCTPLKILDCYGCPLLTNVGFRRLLINSSESLRILAIAECRGVNLMKLLLDAKEATKDLRAGSVLQIFMDKDDSSVQKKKVTKLTEHLQLIEYVPN